VGQKSDAQDILQALHDKLPDNTDVATALENMKAGKPAASQSAQTPAAPATKLDKTKKLPINDTSKQ
jgi:hypothetical protein